MGMSYGWWTRRVVLPPAQGGTNRFDYPKGPALPERGWGSGWTCAALSPHMDVRPYERSSLQLSHTNTGWV
jgi:hypothetical protein